VVIAPGIRYVDLKFKGTSSVIATVVLQAPGGAALIDPGPSSALGGLRAGLAEFGVGMDEIEAILLTHIHLDHAGATGTLVRECPRAKVYVHERGAPHMVDPAKLLASAARLYGDSMDDLWGPVEAVPADRVVALAGGETVTAGGRTLEVAYTPGHASHHVSYFDRETRIALVGDTAGIKVPEAPIVLPPTPPPDVDVEAWHASVDRILSWRPETLFLTHFGPVMSPATHLQEMLERLDRLAAFARALLAKAPETGDEAAEEAARQAAFAVELTREIRRHADEETVRKLALAIPFSQGWLGLARYWRKRA
jgi:glyoxylase-like metal-dependent hydrolase (beta-lactamase superfamily II)